MSAGSPLHVPVQGKQPQHKAKTTVLLFSLWSLDKPVGEIVPVLAAWAAAAAAAAALAAGVSSGATAAEVWLRG